MKNMKFWIGQHRYTIRFYPMTGKDSGEIHPSCDDIHIDSTCSNAIQKRSVLHEMIHGYASVFEHDEVITEKIVRTLDPIWNILADPRNEEVINFLFRGKK